MGALDGRVAIVTGAARGIGRAASRALAQDGAAVLATDVIDDEGEALAGELRGEGLDVRFLHHDVSAEDGWAAATAAAMANWGRIDVLVNNAGIGSTADAEHETLEVWDRVIAINQTGVMLGMRAVIPHMRASGGGSIINVSSIFGAVGGFGQSVAYHASKGAVRLMTKTAALRHATEGIRVNSLHPGFVDTPLIAELKGTDVETAILAATPMGRLATAEEIAGPILFLAGDAASYVTGSELYVDGGWTAR
jgi:NAD(P)-dependent dehydrogenase (short-subunit alcohol dehydrogenase family)